MTAIPVMPEVRGTVPPGGVFSKPGVTVYQVLREDTQKPDLWDDGWLELVAD